MDRRLVMVLLGCLGFVAIIALEMRSAGDGEPATIGAGAAAEPASSPIALAQMLRRTPERSLSVLAARPLFNPNRRPPEKDGAVSADFPGKRLAGIVIAPERRIAIFAVDGGKPLAVSEGETVGGWEIASITPAEVLLKGPTGPRSLQPKMDATLAVPSQSSQQPQRPGSPPGAPVPTAPTVAAAGAPGVQSQANSPMTPNRTRPRQNR